MKNRPYELKWDGYRIAVHLDHGKVRILTRGGHDWTHRFPGVEAAAKALGVGSAILDGRLLFSTMRGDQIRSASKLPWRASGKLPAGDAIMFAFGACAAARL